MSNCPGCLEPCNCLPCRLNAQPTPPVDCLHICQLSEDDLDDMFIRQEVQVLSQAEIDSIFG